MPLLKSVSPDGTKPSAKFIDMYKNVHVHDSFCICWGHL